MMGKKRVLLREVSGLFSLSSIFFLPCLMMNRGMKANTKNNMLTNNRNVSLKFSQIRANI